MSNKTKTFQWVKGDRAGEVVKWNGDIVEDTSVGINFLLFTDGSRANETLIGDFFVEIADENDLVLIPDNVFVDAPLPQEKNPPLKRVESWQEPQTIQPPRKDMSPMHKLLSESRKTKATVNVSLVADMPPADLMRVLADSYDDGEQQVLDYISSTINVEDIKAQIAKQIWLAAFSMQQDRPKARRNKKSENETA